MKYTFKILSCCALLLMGCSNDIDIKNQKLKDKVNACSLAFSEELSLNLSEHIEKSLMDGKLSAGFKDGLLTIFDILPEADRLKAYEDYIACIESDCLLEKCVPSAKKVSKKKSNPQRDHERQTTSTKKGEKKI